MNFPFSQKYFYLSPSRGWGTRLNEDAKEE